MDEAMHAYFDDVHERNSRRDAKSKSEPVKVDREETKAIREEVWWFWVKQRIRRVVNTIGADGKGGVKITGRMVIYKPITGDPAIDGDNGHENAVEVFEPN